MKASNIKNITFIIVLIVIIVGCFFLGIWQVDRYTKKQRLYDTASVGPEVTVTDLINSKNDGALIDSTVHINGSFLADAVFKLDNRIFNSIYGIELFSLFKEESSNKVYLVNMGWLEVGNNRNKLTQHFDFSDIHTVHAKISNIPSKPPFVSKERFQDDNQQDLWLFVNREYLSRLHKTPIEDLALVNIQPANNLKYRAVTKENNAIMHIFYAIQWFIFSFFALFGLIKIYK